MGNYFDDARLLASSATANPSANAAGFTASDAPMLSPFKIGGKGHDHGEPDRAQPGQSQPQPWNPRVEHCMRNLEEFAPALGCIPADDRDVWITVGMALHYESGGRDEGRQLWDTWSQKSQKYNSAEQDRQWKSFKLKPDGVGAGTIIKLARDHGCSNGHNGFRSSHTWTERPQQTAEPKASATTQQPVLWKVVEDAMTAKGHQIAAVYGYNDEHGVFIAENIRFEPKTFRWRHPHGKTYVAGKPEGRPLPPYGLGRALDHADEPLFDAEGERDADRVCDEGQVCISTPSGHEHYAASLLLDRTINILADNDKTGRDRAKAKLAAYLNSGISARIIELPGLPENGDVSDWLDAGNTISDLIKLTEDAAIRDANDLLAGVMWSDDIQITLAGRYLIKKVLPASGIGFLYGPSYSGKTFAAHDIGLAVARGTPLAGKHPTMPGITVYIALEDERGIQDRHIAHRQAYGFNAARLAFLSYPLQITDTASVAGLVKSLRAIARQAGGVISLLVIDPLAQAMIGFDENSARDMAVAVRGLKTIQCATGGCVLVVHHMGKDTKAGMRGSSAAFAAADFVLRVEGSEGGGVRELHVEKLKNGRPRLVGAYAIEPHVIGRDDEGEDIEAAIIQWVEGARAKRDKKLTDRQQNLLSHIEQLIINGQCTQFVGLDGVPDNVPVVLFDDLVERAVKKGDVTASDQPRPARESIRTQIIRLQSKGVAGIFDGKVWQIKG